ncbi:peptide/nickel transport system ATP-binding protein [Sinobacterium caligoides]|uniref:Peptide/nickel transport system ATP-binding protein n=1 Tax=Sinobacterium caligoides TaxID=933926 RepID=A0A3N2DJL3_9GAMM|nr:dipeptide ABC transporter ATP-binding protein [Sinobacterium caligoides]ROR99992.1 peptide/nickel transport system ATP-binding protein [Sinobacterium caligoides]
MIESKSTPLLIVDKLVKHYPVKAGVFKRTVAHVKAVDDVSFKVLPGETLGLVGESGCGKSSLGKTILQLQEATSGSIEFDGQRIDQLNHKQLKHIRADLQVIFQDPYESLNSRHSVGQIIEEPLIVHGVGNAESRKQRVLELLARVGLPDSAVNRYPHEFSGGQRQRIGIARAIALNPKLIICDEPVSALDVSIQSQIINLLLELQRELGLALVFIAHDLSVVKHISDRVAVMYLGKIVEVADAYDIYAKPKHPYTQALIAAIPKPDPRQRRQHRLLEGDVPSPVNPPSGCSFHTRCPHQTAQCKEQQPLLTEGENLHQVACHHWQDIQEGIIASQR